MKINCQSVLFYYRCMRLFSFPFYKCCHLMFEIHTNRNFCRKYATVVSVTFANKMYSMESAFGLQCRTYEPLDYRTFGTECCQCRCRTYEPSDWNEEPFISDLQTFGLQNLRTREQSPCRCRLLLVKSK